MAKYRVKDNKTGRIVTFEWHEKEPPTEADFDEIFAKAGEVALEAGRPSKAEKPGLLGSVALGHRAGAADFYNLLANALSLPVNYQRDVKTSLREIGGPFLEKAAGAGPLANIATLGGLVEPKIREVARGVQPTERELAGREGVAHGVAMGIGGLPSALATYIPATTVAGPIGGLALVEALREARRGPWEMAKGGARGAVTGMGLQATRFIPTKIGRGIGTGGLFGGLTAAEGGDVTDITTSALLGSVLGLPGEGEKVLKFGIPPEYLKLRPTETMDAGAEFRQRKIWPRWRPTREEKVAAKTAAKAEVTKVEPQWKPPAEQVGIPMEVPRNVKGTEVPTQPLATYWQRLATAQPEPTPAKAKPAPVAEAKAAPAVKPAVQPAAAPAVKPEVKPAVKLAPLKPSGFSPTDTLFNRPELGRNKTYAWRAMGDKEFEKLTKGDIVYSGDKAATKGNYLAGVPESAGQYGGRGKYLVEFGGVRIEGDEGLVKGSVATRDNITRVWKYTEHGWEVVPLVEAKPAAKPTPAEVAGPTPTVVKPPPRVDSAKLVELRGRLTRLREEYKTVIEKPQRKLKGVAKEKGEEVLGDKYLDEYVDDTFSKRDEKLLDLRTEIGKVEQEYYDQYILEHGPFIPKAAAEQPKPKPAAEPIVGADKVQARLYRVHTSEGSVVYFTKAELAEAFPDNQGIAIMEMKRPLTVGSVKDISKVNLEDYKAAGYEAVRDDSGRVVVFNDRHVAYRGNLTEGEFQPLETSELSKLVVEVEPPTWKEPAKTPPAAKPTVEQARAAVMARPGMQKTYDKILQARGKTVARDWLDRQIDDYRNGAGLWDALKNDKGGTVLMEGLGSAYEALYKAGVYLSSKLGTRGKRDLGPLQDRIRHFLSPHYLAEVEPYPDRFIDFLKTHGLTKRDMETIAKTGGKVSFATQADLKKVAIRGGYYNPKEGGSFIETLRKDMLSAYYGEGEPVYSAKRGAAPAIVKGGLEYKLWEKRTDEGLKRVAHKAYEKLTPQQQAIVVDLLRSFTSKGEVPEWVLKDYPAEVEAFRMLREHIFNPLYRTAKEVDPTVKPYLEAYFPIIYKEFKYADIGKKAYLIKAFAREHGINEALAERIIEKGLPKSAYYGHLKESRKPYPPMGLEQVLDLDTVVDMYIHGTTRFTGLNRWIPEARRHLANLPLESNIYKAMGEYIKVLSGHPLADDAPLPKWLHTAARVEGYRQIITKLGFNLAGAAVNYSQWFINSGTQALADSYNQGSTHPLYRFAEATARAWTKKGQRVAARSGIFTDVGKGELRVKDIHGVLGKVAGVTTAIFDAAERLNKAGEWARVYQDNIQAGRAKGLTGRALLQYAKRESMWSEAKTQFFMGAGDRPIGLMGPGLSTIARFKVFTIKQLEYMANLRGAEKAAFISTILLLDGPQGIGLDIVHGELEEHFPDSEVVKDLGQVQKYLQNHSLSGLLGIELTGKIGIGFFPGLENSARVFSALLQGESWVDATVLGGVTARDISNVFSDIAEGRLAMSIEQIGKAALEGELSWKDFQSLQHAVVANRTSFLLPVGLRRALKAEEVARTGEIRGRMGEIQKRDVGPADIAKIAVGFQPEELVQRREAVGEYRSELEHANWRKTIIAAEWQDAAKRGDRHKLKLLREQLAELNKEWVARRIPPLDEGLITRLTGKELEMELRGIPPIGRARLLREKRQRER